MIKKKLTFQIYIYKLYKIDQFIFYYKSINNNSPRGKSTWVFAK